MNKEGKDIGDLFKSGLQDYKAEISEEEWLATEIQVKGKNFFRFSVSNFNIYYCTLFLTSFVLSSIVFVDYYFLRERTGVYSIKEEVLAPVKNSFPQQNSNPTTSVENSNPTENVTINPAKPVKEAGYSTNTSPKNNLITGMDTVKKTDDVILAPVENTTIPAVVKSTDSAATVQKPKQKKIIYITRQDTLRVYDTLDAKKIRKRRK